MLTKIWSKFRKFFEGEEENMVIALILSNIQHNNSARNQRHLLKKALVTPKQSSWFKLYYEAGNNSFLTIMEFNRVAIDYLRNIIHAA